MASLVTVIPASRIPTYRVSEKKKLRVAAYCRVSTEQEEQLGSFENQVDYYTQLITNNDAWENAGIFADEGISGTRVKKRVGFQSMIEACEQGKVDMIITKSISRFARNTADCLQYSRKLKDLGIPIVFEKENINTMEASGELLFTILSSLAQEESRNISENTTWGIRNKMRTGTFKIFAGRTFGFKNDADMNVVVNHEQAEVVKRIFREFLEGWQVNEIAHHLNDDGISGVTGEPKWNSAHIELLLKNEKHKGDVLLQKSYTVSFLTKERTVNDGVLDQYYMENHHEAIIEPEIWDAVQLELERRSKFRSDHNVYMCASRNNIPFFAKVFCGKCGSRIDRVRFKGIREPVYKCANYRDRGGCDIGLIRESDLRQAVVTVWNEIVAHQDEHIPRWNKMIKEGDALQKLRGRQMKELMKEGPLKNECLEMTKMILHEVVAVDNRTFTIKLMDGYETTICL